MHELPSIPWPGSEAAALAAAQAHFNAGQHAAAAALFIQLLERNPDHRQGLVFLGVIYIVAGDSDAAAEPLFQRYLELDGDGPFAPLALRNLGIICQRRGENLAAVGFFEQSAARQPDFASVLNDLGVSLQRLGRQNAAIAAFDRALALDPGFAFAHFNRAQLLLEIGRVPQAVEAFRLAFEHAPDSVEIGTALGSAYLRVENFAAAEKALRQVLALDPGALDARLYLAEALDGQYREEESALLRRAWAKDRGIIITPSTAEPPQARILLLGGAATCNTPTRFLFSPDRFATVTINILPIEDGGEAPEALAAILPACDVIFGAIADADRGTPFIEPAAALCRALGWPVINPPERIPLTRRDRVTTLLAGIPDIVVPATRRLDGAALLHLDKGKERYAAPFLLRPAGAHGGAGLARIEHGGGLADYLRATPAEDYYETAYCEYRSADGLYRKYRLIFVDREVYPYHLAISRHWMIHYFRTEMGAEEWRREEAVFLADYESVFPGALSKALRRVAERLDLDYGGIDCGIMPDGRILLFEANANMLVHGDDPRAEFAYKRTAAEQIARAIDRLVARKRALASA